MDDKLNDSAADALPVRRSEGESSSLVPGRRQALLRSAAASAPLFMALAPGAAMAAASAHHGAANDAVERPPGYRETSDKDGWIRVTVPYGPLTEKDAPTDINLGIAYRLVPGDASSGTVWVPNASFPNTVEGTSYTFDNSNSSNGSRHWSVTGYRLVLVLFAIDSQTQLGYWPQYVPFDATRQALHCSSWSSIGPDTVYPASFTGC